MTSIKLIVRGAEASAEVSGILTAGMVGIPVTIDFDDSWEGLSRNLICRGGLGYENFEGIAKTILGIETSAKVAPEVMVEVRWTIMPIMLILRLSRLKVT